MLRPLLNRFRKKPPLHMVVHVGMHKTGTSSIQDTFFHRQNPDFEYVNWSAANHCGLFVLLFQDEDKLAKYHGFAARGPEFIAQLPQLRADWHQTFTQQISETRAGKMLFSAEDIASPDMAGATETMHGVLAPHAERISAVGYVRNPRSLIESLFQQNLKGGGLEGFVQGKRSPDYIRRFRHIDRVFGRENVTLKEFAPGQMRNGDVVQDFARTIDVQIPHPGEMRRTNESLSLEACACLYVQRKFGRGYVRGFNKAQLVNRDFIDQLAQLGGRKLAFSDAMVDLYFGDYSKDLSWMENRLGHAFSDPDKRSSDAITSLDDLEDVALGQFDAVQTLLGETGAVSGPATLDTLVASLEALHQRSLDRFAE